MKTQIPVLNEAVFTGALTRWRRPTPRLALGRALMGLPIRISCMDVSDGLTASLQQLNRITGLGFSIEAARLPIDPFALEIARLLRMDPIQLACSASVDFELLISCHVEDVPTVLRAAAAVGTQLSPIGRCRDISRLEMATMDGDVYPAMPGTPWDHQTDDPARLFDAAS